MTAKLNLVCPQRGFIVCKISLNLMEKIFNWEQWRIVAISAISPIFGYLTPTKGFVYALVAMFALTSGWA